MRNMIIVQVYNAVFHISIQVKEFLSDTLDDLRSTWARGITYNFCVACPCSKEALHFLDLDQCINSTKSSGILRCMKRKSVSVKSLFQWVYHPDFDVNIEGMKLAISLRQ